MTIFGIDISHHQQGINLQRVKDEGFSFVIARVGQGAGGKYGTTKDREFIRNRDLAWSVGLPLISYWYIGSSISPEENSRLCKLWMEDSSIPVILDCEDGSGDINFYRQVLESFRSQGMYVPLSYIPRWYWQQLGSPSLADLPPLWSSRYVSGDGYASRLYPGDNSTYWSNYGSNRVELLQFSSVADVAGFASVDVNAYRGTLEQFLQLVSRPAPKPDPIPEPEVIDMQLDEVVGHRSNGTTFTVRDALQKAYLDSTDDRILDTTSSVAFVLNDLVSLVRKLPVDYSKDVEEKLRELINLLYLLHDQPTWGDLASLTWGDLSELQWGRLNG